jgi:hypothetical protein
MQATGARGQLASQLFGVRGASRVRPRGGAGAGCAVVYVGVGVGVAGVEAGCVGEVTVLAPVPR